MSWVAEEKATTTANTASHHRSARGSQNDMASRPSPMPVWASSIHERRRPSRRVRKGSGTRSTTGDHTNLME